MLVQAQWISLEELSMPKAEFKETPGPESPDEELRKAEDEKKKSMAASDSYDADQAELAKMIAQQTVQKDGLKEALDEKIEKAYDQLRIYQRHMVKALVIGAKNADQAKKFQEALEKIPVIPKKKVEKDALRAWYKSIDNFSVRITPDQKELWDLKEEFKRLVKEQNEIILNLRKEQIAKGITLEELSV